MHSRIFEIRDENFKPTEWANKDTISDGDGNIDGADYWTELREPERVESIENFFTKWFPGNSFKIVNNEPGKTAIVKFVGNIDNLFTQWRKQIQDAAEALTIDNMDDMGVFRVRMACIQPFELSTKFYQEDWNGCTVDADDFFWFLRYKSKQTEGKPFCLYIGQAFDYHF